MKPNTKAYRKASGDDGRVRVVAILPEVLVSKVDAWGVPAGMPSRTEAIKRLLQYGLSAAEKEKAGEPLTA